MVGAPAALAAVREGCGVPDRLMKRLEKSTFPISNPIGGISTSLTSDETIFPNAPPMITPIAMSSTLPFIAKSLNSFSICPPHDLASTSHSVIVGLSFLGRIEAIPEGHEVQVVCIPGTRRRTVIISGRDLDAAHKARK